MNGTRGHLRLRLLPVAIFAAVLMLGVKIGGLWHGIGGDIVAPSTARAAAPAPAPVRPAGQKSAAKPAASPAADPAAEKSAPTTAGAASGGGLPDDPALFTGSEIALLQKLADRHKELDRWAHDLSLREALLKATEQRVDGKVAELTKLKAKIQGLLRQYDAEQEKKLKSLVKIYESMKPKDAARIFMALDLPVLLDVIERMREQKAAAILAEMDPEKAKKVTVALAERRQLDGDLRDRLPSSGLPSSGAQAAAQ